MAELIDVLRHPLDHAASALKEEIRGGQNTLRQKQQEYYNSAQDPNNTRQTLSSIQATAASAADKALDLAVDAGELAKELLFGNATVSAVGTGIERAFLKDITPAEKKDKKDESEVESGDENSPLTLSPHQPTADPALTLNPHQPTVNPDLTVTLHQPKPEPNSPVGQSLLSGAAAVATNTANVNAMVRTAKEEEEVEKKSVSFSPNPSSS